MATGARFTAQDLLRTRGQGVRRELVDGRIIEMAPHGFEHGEIAARLSRKLVEYVEQTGGGRVVTGDVGFVLDVPGDPERVRALDVAFVGRDRLPQGAKRRTFFVGAPDLAVEILSPADATDDVQQRVRDFLDAGARMVWLIAPEARTATVFRADGSARLLREHDVLEGEDVLPGLAIPLSSVLDA